MTGSAAPANNDKPQEQAAPATNDAASRSSAQETQTLNKLLEDSRPNQSNSGSDKTSKGSSTENQNQGGSQHNGDGAGGTGAGTDASSETGDVASSANERLRKEVEDGYKSPEARSLFNNARLSANVMAMFGTPEFVSEARADLANGGRDAQNDARRMDATPAVTPAADANLEGQNEKAPEAKAVDSSLFGDISNWASTTFNDNVLQPAQTALNFAFDMYGAANDWLFDTNGSSGQGSAELLAQATGSVAALNDVSAGDFRQQRHETMDNFKYDFKGQDGLELPANATADGVADIAGEKVAVFRTPEGETFLKKGDTVIARQDKDGNYDLALKDGSTARVRLSKEGDQYKLDHLERYKGDQLQQKVKDGVFYNYNYDSQGNRTVDAAADIRGQLTQEQLDQRLEAIRKELGPNGTAALRFGEGHDRHRLMMQTHGDNTHSLTDVDQKRARIFHNGQEFRLNEHDQLGVVDKDGTWKGADKADQPADAESQRLKELADLAARRARGDGQTDIDGVKLEITPDGDAVIKRVDPHTGEQQSHTELPASPDNPITITNDQTGERTNMQGGVLTLEDRSGSQILGFDPNTGFTTNDFQLDENGLTDLQNGMNLDQDGSLFDGDGEFISGLADGEGDWFFTEKNESLAEHRENMQTSHEASAEVSNLGGMSLSISRSGNPNAVGIARSVAAEALGIANSALGDLGNDFLAKIPVYNSQSIAETALTQANREDRTQTYAMRMGISDTTRLSEFNKLATFSTTSMSPEEYVRHRIMRVA
jgi:hypothetical protein